MGNRVYKSALLHLIQDTMWEKAVAFVHTDEGYSYESDMIHFSSDGHKCILLGVGCPDVEKGTIPLQVLTDGNRMDVKRLPTRCTTCSGTLNRTMTGKSLNQTMFPILWTHISTRR